MLYQFTNTIRKFPRNFWILVIASFIDRIGGTLIFPFFSLYITQKFSVGMTQAGLLLAIFSVSGLVGSIIGGALTDRFGRRSMVLFGLVFSALSSVTMGLVDQLYVFYFLGIFVGLFSNIAGPAHQAMVADMLPEENLSEGFGIFRVSGNLAWIIGPTIGGLLASVSYLLLFILDATASLIVAAIVFRLIPETMSLAAAQASAGQSFWKTISGYRQVAADRLYLGFLVTSMLMLIVYQQMYSTLSVFLRDQHGISAQGYGALLSTSAITVVLFQIWISRKINPYPAMLLMVLGTLFYLVGFTMFGFVSQYSLFAAAIIIITIGEMIIMPTSQSIAARFAPETMRGRYMAFFTLAWTIPATIGPWAAGLVMDNINPNWVWYAGGLLCCTAATGFFGMHYATRRRFVDVPLNSR